MLLESRRLWVLPWHRGCVIDIPMKSACSQHRHFTHDEFLHNSFGFWRKNILFQTKPSNVWPKLGFIVRNLKLRKMQNATSCGARILDLDDIKKSYESIWKSYPDKTWKAWIGLVCQNSWKLGGKKMRITFNVCRAIFRQNNNQHSNTIEKNDHICFRKKEKKSHLFFLRFHVYQDFDECTALGYDWIIESFSHLLTVWLMWFWKGVDQTPKNYKFLHSFPFTNIS